MLEAVGKELSTHGYHGMSISSIVKRAKSTKGCLFHHFTDKESLVVSWVEGLVRPKLEDAWITPLAEVRRLEDLVKLGRLRVETMTEDAELMSLVLLFSERASLPEILAGTVDALLEGWRLAIEEVLQRGKEGGWLYRSIQVAVEADLLISLIVGMCVMRMGQKGTSGKRGAEALAGYLETLRAQ